MVVLNIRGLAFMEIIITNSEAKERQEIKGRRRSWRRRKSMWGGSRRQKKQKKE